jgi:hypothetical protein
MIIYSITNLIVLYNLQPVYCNCNPFSRYSSLPWIWTFNNHLALYFIMYVWIQLNLTYLENISILKRAIQHVSILKRAKGWKMFPSQLNSIGFKHTLWNIEPVIIKSSYLYNIRHGYINANSVMNLLIYM